MSKIEQCNLIELPKIYDVRGSLTFIEGSNTVPFDIKRIYYLYDIPSFAERGGHAHRNLKQLIIAISGSFDIEIDDGNNKKTYSLNKPNFGLLVHPYIWREITNFSSGAVCLVAASEIYDESDYIRQYDDLLKEIND